MALMPPIAAAARPAHRATCDLLNSSTARDEHDGHDQVDPAVGLEAVPEDRTFQIFREHPVITEGPDRIEDPHDARQAQDDGRERYPPSITRSFHRVPFLTMPVFAGRRYFAVLTPPDEHSAAMGA
jgi:hypothetical protein